MKAAALAADPASLAPTRLADYVALTKPRIAALVLFTVAAGALLAGGTAVSAWVVVHTVLGTALVAAGASALNQLLERHTDALMRRTETRPLPAGRMQPAEVLLFGAVLAVAGVAYLGLTLRQVTTPLLAVVTFAIYVGVYTPLKTRTTLNTLVGAVPGALPPVIGWTAVRGLDAGAWALFLIVFVWQVPHFLAIAWIYRDDYGRAGMRMLPVVDRDGRLTGRQMLLYCLTLIVVGFTPTLWCGAGAVYHAGALLLGAGFLAAAAAFAWAPGVERARLVLRASLVYLPGLLAVLLLDVLSRAG